MGLSSPTMALGMRLFIFLPWSERDFPTYAKGKKSSTTSCLGAMGSRQPRIWSFRTDPRPETTPVVGYGTDRFRVKEPPFGQSQRIANRFRFQRRNGCGGAPFSYGT